MSATDLIEVSGLVIAVASVVCTVANAAIRSAVEHGYAVPRWLLVVAAALNAVALNGDKTVQLARGYRGPSSPPRSPTGEVP